MNVNFTLFPRPSRTLDNVGLATDLAAPVGSGSSTEVPSAVDFSPGAESALADEQPFGPDYEVSAAVVQPWNPNSAGQSDANIAAILRNRGFSNEEIFGQDENGLSLVDRVAHVNELEDPDLVFPGQELVIPLKPEVFPELPPPPGPTPI